MGNRFISIHYHQVSNQVRKEPPSCRVGLPEVDKPSGKEERTKTTPLGSPGKRQWESGPWCRARCWVRAHPAGPAPPPAPHPVPLRPCHPAPRIPASRPRSAPPVHLPPPCRCPALRHRLPHPDSAGLLRRFLGNRSGSASASTAAASGGSGGGCAAWPEAWAGVALRPGPCQRLLVLLLLFVLLLVPRPGRAARRGHRPRLRLAGPAGPGPATAGLVSSISASSASCSRCARSNLEAARVQTAPLQPDRSLVTFSRFTSIAAASPLPPPPPLRTVDRASTAAAPPPPHAPARSPRERAHARTHASRQAGRRRAARSLRYVVFVFRLSPPPSSAHGAQNNAAGSCFFSSRPSAPLPRRARAQDDGLPSVYLPPLLTPWANRRRRLHGAAAPEPESGKGWLWPKCLVATRRVCTPLSVPPAGPQPPGAPSPHAPPTPSPHPQSRLIRLCCRLRLVSSSLSLVYTWATS